MNTKKISLLTFNIQGVPSYSKKTLDRLTLVAKHINQVSADVINIQEVFTYKHLNIIKSELTNYPYISFGKGVIGPRGGLVTFSKRKFTSSKYISYSFFELIKHRLFNVLRRNLLSGKGILQSKLDENTEIINTHLIANSLNDQKSSQAFYSVYKKQIMKIASIIKNNSNKVIFISGDFNIPKKSKLYSKMVNLLNSYDVFENNDDPTFHKVFLPSGESGHRLDYIFINSKNLHYRVTYKNDLFSKRLLPKVINHGYFSDHLALIATFVIELP